MDDDERKIVEAKRLAAGPLGQEMATFPMLFAKPVFFGPHPSRNRQSEVSSATVTLVDLGHGPMAVTCQHVMAGYRKTRASLGGVAFYIGSIELDPSTQLIDENARLDLATLRLTSEQTRRITLEHKIGSCVFTPPSWPPASLREGDYVAFGGFPAALRHVLSFDELEFLSWSSGASRIISANEDRLVSVFEREYWVKSFGAEHQMDLTALGGMSGGPAFVLRGLYWDFVGIISDYEKNYDAMLFASARALRPDGTIEPPPV